MVYHPLSMAKEPTCWDAVAGIAGWIAVGAVVLFLVVNALLQVFHETDCDSFDDPYDQETCHEAKLEEKLEAGGRVGN